MRIRVLLAAGTFVLSTVALVAQSGNTSQTASPSNDQNASAYGNNTYHTGAKQQPPASMNSSPTTDATAEGPSGGTNTNRTSGSPNASHTSNPDKEGLAGNDSTTSPSTVNPGNGNSPSSTPPGAGGSNTGTAAPRDIATRPATEQEPLVSTALQAQTATAPQTANQPPAQQNPSGTQTGSSGTNSGMPGTTPNATLQERINDALRNEPTLGASHVTAAVSDGSIDLSGTVGSTKDKQTAERIASSFDGNRRLHDNVVVTGAGHSDLAPNHPAMNNGGTGDAPNPAMKPNQNPQK